MHWTEVIITIGYGVLARYLLKFGAYLHKYNHSKYFFNAAKKGMIDIVKIFVENGFDVDIKDQNGETPLFKAVKGANYNICKYLHENGAKLDIINNKNVSLKTFIKRCENKLISNYFSNAVQLDKKYFPESPVVLKSYANINQDQKSSQKDTAESASKQSNYNSITNNKYKDRTKKRSLISVSKCKPKNCCSYLLNNKMKIK